MRVYPRVIYEFRVSLLPMVAAQQLGELVQPTAETDYGLFGSRPFEGQVSASGFSITRIGVLSFASKLRATGQFLQENSTTVVKVNIRPSVINEFWFWAFPIVVLLIWIQELPIKKSGYGFVVGMIGPFALILCNYLLLAIPFYFKAHGLRRRLETAFEGRMIHPDHVA